MVYDLVLHQLSGTSTLSRGWYVGVCWYNTSVDGVVNVGEMI